MFDLTKKAKIALAGGGAGLATLAAALGIWQPWKEPVPEQPDPPPQQQVEVLPTAPEEPEGLSLTVGGEKIPCTLFQGDGWSVYVPEGWKSEGNGNGGKFETPEGDVRVEVIRGASGAYEGSFVSAFPQHLSADETWQSRLFYAGGPDFSWEFLCSASEERWDDHNRLMTALARTFTVGEDKPFSGLSPVASQPDWQIAEDETLLWMDKDAYIVDDVVEEHVVTEMMSWDKETKALYTGQYDTDPLLWSGSYTCLAGEGYVDVFSTAVRYKAAEDAGDSVPAGMTFADGWFSPGGMHVAVFHDGSAVEEVRFLAAGDTPPGDALFAATLAG